MAKSNVIKLPKRDLHATVSDTASFDDLCLNPTEYGIEFTNPRRTFSKADVKSLAEDIARVGVQNPLQVWRTADKDGKTRLVIIGGQRRYLALEMLREGKLKGVKAPKSLFDEVPVRVTDGLTATEARVRAFRDNSDHEQMTDYDLTVALADLVFELGGKGHQKEAVALIGKSTTWASRRLRAYENASEPLKKAWQAGKVPFDDVKDIASISDAKGAQQKKLTEYLDTRQSNAEGETRKSKAEAKKKLNKKEAAPKPERVKPGVLADMAAQLAGAKDDYLRGMHDMAKFALGELPMGKLDKSYKEHAAKLAKTDRK
jgi:ParB-like chromosome segregation protein Spo0J